VLGDVPDREVLRLQDAVTVQPGAGHAVSLTDSPASRGWSGDARPCLARSRRSWPV
jgi:hypothetical protein